MENDDNKKKNLLIAVGITFGLFIVGFIIGKIIG